MDNKTNGLAELLAQVGTDEAARSKIIEALADWERRSQAEGVDLRETVTGPLVDALHKNVPKCTRTLTSGLTFTLPYTSKIGREFAMASQPLSHVWEPQTTRLLVSLARDAKQVIVGGAYAGDHAIPMAKVVAKPNGRVHCFELQPVQLAAIKTNMDQNDLNNVVINAIGVCDRAGYVVMEGEDSHATSKFVATNVPGSFPVTAIDDYVAANNIASVDLIMLDIEGGEEAALKGAIKQLARPANEAPDVVFEIHRHYVDWSNGIKNTALLQMFYQNGYEVYGIRDFQANVNLDAYPIELVDLDTIYLEGPPHGFNMFATKKPGRVASLGLQVRKNVSPKLLRHRFSPLHQPDRATTNA